MADTKAIRAELKKVLGYNSRQVSVRMRHYSNIVFTIRTADIKKAEIKEFASQYESYQRDHATGEILCGGNTFVDVQYSDEVETELMV